MAPFHRSMRISIHSLRASWRAGAVAFALLAGSTAAGAQTISPPVAEHVERTSSSFQVTNNTITPLVVVLDVRGFVVDSTGTLSDTPLDTSRVKVQLSEMSFRLPPRATRTIFYEATPVGGPAWFQVIAAFTGARAANGLNLRIELPHVVYLNQRAPLARADVVVRTARFDAETKTVEMEFENVSDRLGRLQELAAIGTGTEASGPAMPLFPHSRRRVTIDWTASAAPVRIAAKFAGFTLDVPVTR